jgi:putative endonuclease
MYFVYVLHSELTDKFYIGSTQNLSIRLDDHNNGRNHSTKPGRPWHLVYSASFETKAQAIHRELEIKRWKNPKFMCQELGIYPE